MKSAIIAEIKSKPLIPETEETVAFIKSCSDLNEIDLKLEKFKAISTVRSKPLIPETEETVAFIKSCSDQYNIHDIVFKFKLLEEAYNFIIEKDETITLIKETIDENKLSDLYGDVHRLVYINKACKLKINKKDIDISYERDRLIHSKYDFLKTKEKYYKLKEMIKERKKDLIKYTREKCINYLKEEEMNNYIKKTSQLISQILNDYIEKGCTDISIDELLKIKGLCLRNKYN